MNFKKLPGPRIFRPFWYDRILPSSVHPLCRIIWQRLKTECMTMRDICDKSGISDNTIRGWFRVSTNSPTLQNLEACLGVFELTLIAVPSEWLGKNNGTRSMTNVKSLEEMVRRAKEIEAEENTYSPQPKITSASNPGSY